MWNKIARALAKAAIWAASHPQVIQDVIDISRK